MGSAQGKDQENFGGANGRDEGRGNDKKKKQEAQDGSPSVSPERRNRRQDLSHFENEMANRASVPRKSHVKKHREELDSPHENNR